MKGISKKLVSILAVVCLLASIALPAGLLTTAAEETDPVVMKIDFDDLIDANKAARYCLGSYETPGTYIISFEYYMPSDTSVYLERIGAHGTYVSGSGIEDFKKGHHTYTATYTTSGGNNWFVPSLRCTPNASIDDVMYVWNYSVTTEAGAPATSNNSTANQY